ncbi:uncharacterized protein [Diadema setosum]|uniref:uncharacterized protein n=1 Tax=Diadema setosum TaxID=31175 RepID=UPI003B3BE95E
MPNSGFQGQINQSFYGTRKADLVPLGDQYVTGNLPNPAFWSRFMREPFSGVSSGSSSSRSTLRVLTTTEVLAPVRPSNIHSQLGNRSTDGTLPRIKTSPSGVVGIEDQAPSDSTEVGSPPSRGHARDAHIPLVALNSLAPFATTSKPTCGYFFSRNTDNRKKSIGIPATDLVAYRYYVK